MATWPTIVESFPLTVSQVFRQYTTLPSDASEVFYHYTTRAGLEGILRSGGFRATYRMGMNDAAEFAYARNVVYTALDELGRRTDLPKVATSLITYARKNLDRLPKDTTEMASSYCACLTTRPDDSSQWTTYAGRGTGFAIGFHLPPFLKTPVSAVKMGEPFIYCAPVTYDPTKQRELVSRLVEAAIYDLQIFAAIHSQRSEHLTALRDRVTREIATHLVTLIDFLKAPAYRNEREIRLILDANNGTLSTSQIQHFERDNQFVPFVFMDLRDPTTRRLPLAEIWIGPRAVFSREEDFLKNLLYKLSYGTDYDDQPRIMRSSLKI